MSGFTKLVPEIIQSSIWNQPSDIRIVWITLIASKDKDGYVRGDATTIARMANVPLDVTEKALALFQEKDPSSHTPDNEGKRIVAAPGGWIILNHFLYRAKDRTEYMQKYMRGYRAKEVESVNSVNINKSLPSVSVSVSSSDDAFDTFWKAYPRKIGKGAALSAWKKAKAKPAIDAVLVAIETQRQSEQWRKDNGQFIPHPATWLNQCRWDDEVETKPTRWRDKVRGTILPVGRVPAADPVTGRPNANLWEEV